MHYTKYLKCITGIICIDLNSYFSNMEDKIPYLYMLNRLFAPNPSLNQTDKIVHVHCILRCIRQPDWPSAVRNAHLHVDIMIAYINNDDD